MTGWRRHARPDLGDREAARILEENTDRIAELVNFTARAHQCGPDVIVSGGLLDHDDTMVNMLSAKLHSTLRVTVPTLPQIYGACARSCKLYGEVRADFQERFTESYLTFQKREEEKL